MSKRILTHILADSQDGKPLSKIEDPGTDDALSLFIGNGIREHDDAEGVRRHLQYGIDQLQRALASIAGQ